jgi:hypothetical protein
MALSAIGFSGFHKTWVQPDTLAVHLLGLLTIVGRA